MFRTIAAIAVGCLAVLNVVATAMLVRSDFESRFQKTAQVFLIWVFPVVGAILVIAVLTNTRKLHRPQPSDGGSGASLFPGSDGDLNVRGVNDGSPWGGDGGHSG
jgi:hypothetical protein